MHFSLALTRMNYDLFTVVNGCGQPKPRFMYTTIYTTICPIRVDNILGQQSSKRSRYQLQELLSA